MWNPASRTKKNRRKRCRRYLKKVRTTYFILLFHILTFQIWRCYITLHCIALHYILLHCIALHCIASHHISSHVMWCNWSKKMTSWSLTYPSTYLHSPTSITCNLSINILGLRMNRKRSPTMKTDKFSDMESATSSLSHETLNVQI